MGPRLKTFLRIFALVILLGGLEVGVILVGQRQLLIREAAEISIPEIAPSPLPSPTPGPDAGRVNFTVKFQETSSSAKDKLIRVTFGQGGANIYTFANVPIHASGEGTYIGQINAINPGVYDISVKGEAQLVRKFPDISVKTGLNSVDFSSKTLLGGDFNGDNKINVNDVGALSANIKTDAVRVNADNKYFDLNGNGFIDQLDMAITLSNYKGLEVFGE